MTSNKGGKPTSEHRHIKWFNSLSAAERKEWCNRADSLRAIDAWRVWKSVEAKHK
jgi:hypothetical protein